MISRTHGNSKARRCAIAAWSLTLSLWGVSPVAWAQAQEPLKIGLLSSMSGILADVSGKGSVVSAKLAIEDYGGKVLGRPIELLEGDHLDKPDTGLTIARQWYDNGVRAIFDVGLTSVALGVQDLAREKNRAVIFTSSASADLTGKNCSPNGIHWAYNSYVLALGAIKGAMDAGAKNWYFITIDYTYGKNAERDATEILGRLGAKVIGSTTHPLTSTEFSSQLLQAQASKADTIALASLTTHFGAIIKQANEFGVSRRQRLVPFGFLVGDIKALGLQSAQGLFLTEAYYWDQNEATRKFAMRYKERVGKMPNMAQASVYGAVTHYLKAIAATGTVDTAAVMAKMRETKINDFMTKDGYIRDDGRVMRDFYVFRVKKPSESTSEWDLYSQVSTIPAAQAFPPGDKTVCSLVK